MVGEMAGRPWQLWGRWVAANTLAELIGLGALAALATAVFTA
jgi:hypothetical protein